VKCANGHGAVTVEQTLQIIFISILLIHLVVLQEFLFWMNNLIHFRVG